VPCKTPGHLFPGRGRIVTHHCRSSALSARHCARWSCICSHILARPTRQPLSSALAPTHALRRRPPGSAPRRTCRVPGVRQRTRGARRASRSRLWGPSSKVGPCSFPPAQRPQAVWEAGHREGWRVGGEVRVLAAPCVTSRWTSILPTHNTAARHADRGDASGPLALTCTKALRPPPALP